MTDLQKEVWKWFAEHLSYGHKDGEKITGAALQQCGLVIPEAMQKFQAWQMHVVKVL